MTKIKTVILVCLLTATGHTGRAQVEWPAITRQCKPWTRWWWMGSAVNEKDLRYNLEQYKAVGLGGMELTPIYGVGGYEDRFIPYLSPRWMQRLLFTLKEAKELDLGVDMSNGTGWPFGGGPLIDARYACRNFAWKTYELHAGQTLADTVAFIQAPLIHITGNYLYDQPGIYKNAASRPDLAVGAHQIDIAQLKEPIFSNKDLQALALDQVRFQKPLPLQALMAYSDKGQVVDLTGKVDRNGRLHWTAPEGDWKLYAIFEGWHGKMVERAAPGAEGNVIDHFSAAAVDKYLSRFDTAFAGKDIHYLRAFFNDSYEVDDARGEADWTPEFFEAFLKYRGYDLRDHLPALLGRGAPDENSRVLTDYRHTISDLLLEKFTGTWRQWAHRKDALIRDQAHGSPANILDLYAASDIPETEGRDILRYKFATSAAHVTGKRLASSESVTWLNEHFRSSPADIRQALDKFLLGGVNHIFYHGTAYSPKDDPWPGWLFYAAVHFTPDEPWWKDFAAVNHYVARCQSFLQQGTPDNDVLLYYPLFDSWALKGREILKHYDAMEPEFRGTGFEENATVMQEKGYAFDYISDKQLQQTQPAGQAIRTGGISYRTVVLPDCHYISVRAFEQLMKLAENGATIIVYKNLPDSVPGWNDWVKRTAQLRALRDRLHFSATANGAIQKAIAGKGAFLCGNDLPALLAYADIRREPMTDQQLSFVRRRNGARTYYFIVNEGHTAQEGFVPLAAKGASAALFDPMTGEKGLAKIKTRPSGNEAVYLQLQPGESCIVETLPATTPGRRYPYYTTAGAPAAIEGAWKIDFVEGGPTLPASQTVAHLGSWTESGGEATKDFSGTALYTISFEKPVQKAAAWLLDLGQVAVSAGVTLNGKPLATLVGPSFRVVVPAADIQAHNTLQIRVSNLMANRIAEMDRKDIPWKKFYNTDFPPHERENRGARGLFDAAHWQPLPSGLLGPVTLTPLRNTF